MRDAKTWFSLVMAPALCVGSVIAAPDTTANDVWRLMEAGNAHVQAVGPEQAFRDFAVRGSKWQQGGFSLSVIGADGRIVVDGDDPGRVGSDIRGVKDATGRAYGEDLAKLVKEWGVSGVEYSVVDSATGRNEWRTSFGTQVPRFDGMLVVGARVHSNALVAAQKSR